MIDIKRYSFGHDWITFPVETFDETKTSFIVSYRGSQSWFLVVDRGLGAQTIHVPFSEIVKLLTTPGVTIIEINNYKRSDDFLKELSRLFESIKTKQLR